MTEITDWQRAEAREGMYHFPTESNRDAKRYCTGCTHADQAGRAGKRDLRERVRCRKMAQHLKDLGRKGAPRIIEAGTPGCKYWEKRR